MRVTTAQSGEGARAKDRERRRSPLQPVAKSGGVVILGLVPAIRERGRKRWQRTCPATARPRRLPSPRIRSRIIMDTATGCAAFPRRGGEAVADYELLEFLLFRAIPRATPSRSPRRCSTVRLVCRGARRAARRLARVQRPGRGRDRRPQDHRTRRHSPARGHCSRRPVLSSW